MKKLIIITLAAGLGLTTFMAMSSPVDAELKFGLAMGKNTPPQPILAITPFGAFKECFALGSGSLVNARLQITLEKMTCSDAHYFYEYLLSSVLVSDKSGELGIKTTHHPPSQSLLNSVKDTKDLYKQIGYTEGLNLITDAELGHWEVEPKTRILIDFVTQPKLARKIPISR